MIPILSQIPLSLSEVQRLKSWLQSSEAALFVETLQARSYTSMLTAGELLKASMLSKDKRGIEAEAWASEAALLDTIIDEMEKVANDDSFMVKLSAITPVKPETETQPEE